MPRHANSIVVLVAIVLLGCHDDSPSVTGPSTSAEPVAANPANLLPPNGGLLPVVESTLEGETERHLVLFDMDTVNVDIEGQDWGIWFGDNESYVQDPPTGDVSWRANQDYAQCVYGIYQCYIYFDPPVRSVTFQYTSWPNMGGPDDPPDAFPFRVSDIYGYTVLADSIRAISPDWDEVTAVHSSGDDLIYKIFFDGNLAIDDLEIVRAAPPAILCDTVSRGAQATCSVRPEVLAAMDSITAWTFDAVLSGGTPFSIDGPASGGAWSGSVVTSGSLGALGWSGGSSSALSGELVVNDRQGAEWAWTTLDWSFTDGGAMVGCPIPNWNKFGPSDSTTLGVNIRASSCYPNSVEPVVADLSGDPGFVATQVAGGGPNDGLWYVSAADYYMERGSLLNPSLLPGYPPDTLGKKDSKDCPPSLRTGPNNAAVVNFYQYNTQCQSRSIQPLLDGVYRHEGFGTGGQDNGHEARRRLGALQPANYPAAAAERVIAVDSAALDLRVRLEVDIVDVVISQESDPNHILVNGNFTTSLYAQSQNGHYNERTVTDAN